MYCYSTVNSVYCSTVYFISSQSHYKEQTTSIESVIRVEASGAETEIWVTKSTTGARTEVHGGQDVNPAGAGTMRAHEEKASRKTRR
jgi:hypothetical protein